MEPWPSKREKEQFERENRDAHLDRLRAEVALEVVVVAQLHFVLVHPANAASICAISRSICRPPRTASNPCE